MRHRYRYRFLYRVGNTYHWESTFYVDSRVEHITCNVDWYWRKQ